MKTIIFVAAVFINSVSWANRESGGRLGAPAVYVQFTSFGTGVDSQAQELYKNLVAEAKAQSLVVDETFVRLGREGESLNCVQLLSGFDRYNFIKKLAPVILSDTHSSPVERTLVFVGPDCHDVSEATRQDLRGYGAK
jgi:hypothetical protein